MRAANPPTSTYRIQFSKDFRFSDAKEIVPYLHSLGIEALYSSPRFRPRKGSTHGYDIADPTRVNSELGSDEDFNDLSEKLRQYKMQLLLDIVPNHMAASSDNPWWMDVLENGPASKYAHYFDIDWHPKIAKAAFLQDGRILLPVLGDLYGNILHSGNLSVRLDENGFYIQYFERRLPIDPATYARILVYCAEKLEEKLGSEGEAPAILRRIAKTAQTIPTRTAKGKEDLDCRAVLCASVKSDVFTLYRENPDVRLAMQAALHGVGEAGDLMHRILEEQGYRLAYWKIGYEEINYRRFFDINDLVSLCVEEEDVFQTSHAPIVALVKSNKVSGLRVDHVDGLFDPEAYLERLQNAVQSDGNEELFVVVEKILGQGEHIPEGWRTSGTTGYEFLNAVNDVFLCPEGLNSIQAGYAAFTGDTASFAEVCYARNKQVIWKLFAGEINMLTRRLGRLAALDLKARDVPMSEIVNALVEVTACLPVYRTYIRGFEVPEADRKRLDDTLQLARKRTRDFEIGDPAFAFLRRVLLLEPPDYSPELKLDYLHFVTRWQQFTGPVMAKGLEDTAGYVYNALISRNDVGSDPVREGEPKNINGFHAFCEERATKWPYALNATSTHDTKRSEDVRARINVLTELSTDWQKRLLQWHQLNAQHRTEVDGVLVPTPSEEVLYYQTLLGAWPLEAGEIESFKTRLKNFAVKAAREGKTYSDWIRPNEPHESACLNFLDKILDGDSGNRFLKSFLRFQRVIAWHGMLNSLSQLVLKAMAPGIPDVYQGTELWDFSLVDPDNRRPVDFSVRNAVLESHSHAADPLQLSHELLANWKNGGVKLYVTDKALDLRSRRRALFLNGVYLPLKVTGPKRDNLCAFARRSGPEWCLVAVPRWTTQLATAGKWPVGTEVWGDSAVCLPEGSPHHWKNALTGEICDRTLAADLLSSFPIAILEGQGAESEK